VAADVQTLETRQLLSSIVVNSTSGGQNYAATVTAVQLDPTHTAVTFRDALNAANNSAGSDTISFDASVFPPNPASPTTIVLNAGTALHLTDKTGTTTISGQAASQVAISGNNLSTVLVIDSGVTAEIDCLTITGGKGSINLGGGQTAAGGIDNEGRLTVQNDVFSNNSGGTFGGGIYNNNILTINGCTFSGNSAQFGGGLYSAGTATINTSTFNLNSAGSNGAGLYNAATVTVENSTLSNNSAGASGGGFYSNNHATIIDSTIVGNSAATSGGGFINLNVVTLADCTIAGNFSALGAGVYNSFSTVTTNGTIIAQNFVSPANHAARDWGGSAAAAGSSYNLIGDPTNSGLVNGTNHNLAGTAANPLNPLLGPLANNGGPTQTMALQAGSAALDAGGTTLPVDPLTGLPMPNDQRGAGFSRTFGSAIDIGALEQVFVPVTAGVNAPGVTYGQHGLVTVALVPTNATGSIALFVDGSATAFATHTLTAGDNGSFTFDVGVLNAGTHSLHAVYTATGNFISSTSDGSLAVAQASATIDALGYNVTYDAKSHTAPVTASGVAGVDLSADLTLTGTVHTNAGNYADSWSFHDASGNYADASGTVGDSIGKASATISVTGYSGTYDATSHSATGTATGVGGVDLSNGLILTATAHTNAGTYADAWTFHDASGNYNDASGIVSDSIGKANATISVSGYSGTYDATSHAATATATGVAGVDLSAGLSLTATSHTNAGTYADAWTFHDASGNYNDASGIVNDSIAKANATISVVGYSGTFDGTSHTATGAATGVGSEDLSSGLTLAGTTHTNAGTYTGDGWSFTDNSGNYNNASGTVIDTIARANAVINVTGYSVTFDGNAHTATGTATGVGGGDLSDGLTLTGTTHTGAGSYLADGWSFVDPTGNYNDSSGTVDDTIARANATINVVGYSVTFDGNAHTATGTATGTGGLDLSAGLTLSGTTHTNAGSWIDNWTFHDATGNYNDASGTASDSIARANALINVVGYSVTYDANSHTATGTASGVGGVNIGADLTLSGTTHTNAGSSVDAWSFHDAGGNYNDASGTVNDSIAKANATINVSGFQGTYDAASHGATGSATGVGGVNLASQLSLGATFKNVPGGTAHWTFSGGSNYNDAAGDVSIVISARTVTGSITVSNKVADGTTTAKISGSSLAGAIAGDDVHLTVGPANFASPNVGNWTVTATGLGLSGAAGGNYKLASTTAMTTASITAGTTSTALSAVLSTQPVINIASNGYIAFKFSNVAGFADGQSVWQLFNGVQFSLKVGQTLYSVKSTAIVLNGSIYVAWRIDQELHADLAALLNAAKPSSKTAVDLQVFATARGGNYTLSQHVHPTIFEQGSTKFWWLGR
jgi:hypothetical protein